MLALIDWSRALAASYCWLSADISFWAAFSFASMAAAVARALATESPEAGRVARTTVPASTATRVITGTITRRGTRALRADRGVEWLFGRSTSVTMGHRFSSGGAQDSSRTDVRRRFSFLPVVGTPWSRAPLHAATGRITQGLTAPERVGTAFVTIASCQLARVIFLAGPAFPPRGRTKSSWPRHPRSRPT